MSKGGLAGLKRFEGLGFKPTLQTRTLGLKMQPTVGEVFPFGEIVGDKVEVPILYKPIVPEPKGIGYSGYTPTKNTFNERFIEDVYEAIKMANARGSIEEPKTILFNIGDLKFIGSGAEHSVYEHPTNPNKVLKRAHGVQ